MRQVLRRYQSAVATPPGYIHDGFLSRLLSEVLLRLFADLPGHLRVDWRLYIRRTDWNRYAADKIRQQPALKERKDPFLGDGRICSRLVRALYRSVLRGEEVSALLVLHEQNISFSSCISRANKN